MLIIWLFFTTKANYYSYCYFLHLLRVRLYNGIMEKKSIWIVLRCIYNIESIMNTLKQYIYIFWKRNRSWKWSSISHFWITSFTRLYVWLLRFQCILSPDKVYFFTHWNSIFFNDSKTTRINREHSKTMRSTTLIQSIQSVIPSWSVIQNHP